MTDKKNPIMTQKNDAQKLGLIANYQAKILKLENLLKLAPYSEVNVFFYAKEMFCSISQDMLPFSLGTEIDLLLRESVTYYEQKIYDIETDL